MNWKKLIINILTLGLSWLREYWGNCKRLKSEEKNRVINRKYYKK